MSSMAYEAYTSSGDKLGSMMKGGEALHTVSLLQKPWEIVSRGFAKGHDKVFAKSHAY
jgi:hypothetical protein